MIKKVSIQKQIIQLTHIHFLYVLAFALWVIVYDASQLISPEATLERWELAGGLLVVTTAIWYLARTKEGSRAFQKSLVGALVAADILFASILVYGDRGMASLGVVLYFVPIATSAALLSRSATLATASLCVAAYALACMKYFVDFFNEGYKAQLYSTIGFYGAMFFVVALLLVVVVRQKTSKQ